jgi:hypothetical protein
MKHRYFTPILAIGTLALGACNDDSSTAPNTTPQTARVRVVNLYPTSTSAGLFANGTAVGGNVNFGSAATTCVDVPVGRSISFRSAGSSTDLTTIASPNFTANNQYTVVLFGSGASAQSIVLNDNSITNPTAGNNAIRIFNGTGTAGDIWVTTPGGALTGTASAANLGAGAGTATFGSYATANSQVRLFNVGTTTGTPRVTTTINGTNLSTNRVGTVFLTESNLTGGTTNASVVAAPCT